MIYPVDNVIHRQPLVGPELKAGGQHESRILAGNYGFNANISFTFQAIKNPYAHLTYLCFGPICKFFGDF